MKTVWKILNGFAQVLSVLSTIIVAAMMLLVVADVVMRFFHMPITGAMEITQMMMVGMILGFAKSCLGKENLKVDFVADMLPKNVQYVLDVVTSIVCIGVCVLLMWRTFDNAMYTLRNNLVYLTLPMVPKWLFVLLLAFGFAGGIIGFLLRIHKLNEEKKAGDHPTEEGEENSHVN